MSFAGQDGNGLELVHMMSYAMFHNTRSSVILDLGCDILLEKKFLNQRSHSTIYDVVCDVMSYARNFI